MLHSSILALQKIMLSSAKNRCESCRALRHTTTPLMFPKLSSLLSIVESPSTHNKNKKGFKGSLWQIPLHGYITPLGSPFKRTKYDTMVMHIMIIEIHLSWKPSFCIINSKHFHSTLSKALLMSNFIAIRPSFPFL